MSNDADQENEEISRLRRQLRALSAVTRQLHAQLATLLPLSQTKVRRGGYADPWLPDLERLAPPVEVEVLTLPTNRLWLREGDTRRAIKSGLLAVALEREFGRRRVVEEPELEQWVEGPPVEVMETAAGPMFVIVGGVKMPLRGLPPPFPVSAEAVARFPEGPELAIWSSSQTRGGPRNAAGAVDDLQELARKVRRRTKRELRRLSGSNGS